jgi:hypothetical protein
MFKFIKNKIQLLNDLYQSYRQRIESQKIIQGHADYITKQCAYERIRYGHVIDRGLNSWFVGVIPDNWRELMLEDSAHKDWTIRELNSLADYAENLRKK